MEETVINVNAQLSDLKIKSQESAIASQAKENLGNDEAVTALQTSLAEANSKIAEMTSQLSNAPPIDQAPVPVDQDSDTIFANLQEQLRQLESEAEDLRAKLQAFEAAKEVSTDGTATIVDQLASQIESIRVELSRKHEERIKGEEERFKKRADKMKEALNKQISKMKDENRTSISGPSQEALDNLIEEHNEQIQAINRKHAEELAELQQQSKQTTETTPTEQTVAYIPSEEQIKDLLKNNAYARKLIQNSMDNRAKKILEEEQLKSETALKKSEEASTQRLEAEIKQIRDTERQRLETELKGIDEKIKKARDEAEAMTKKKFDVKFSMTENRMNMAVAKVTYVQTAAKDTPSEPVSKVWEIAKDIKPAPKPAVKPIGILATPTTQAGQPSPTGTALNSGTSVSAPAQASAVKVAQNISSAPQSDTAAISNSHSGMSEQVKSVSQGTNSGQTSGIPQAGGLRRHPGFGLASGTPAGIPAGAVALGIIAPTSQAPATGMAQSQHARGGRGGSGIPRGTTRGRGGSGIPALRGGKIVSGGGARSIETINAVAANFLFLGRERRYSFFRASAAQFIPGQKRGLEEGENAGDEKRTKTE